MFQEISLNKSVVDQNNMMMELVEDSHTMSQRDRNEISEQRNDKKSSLMWNDKQNASNLDMNASKVNQNQNKSIAS